MGVNPDRNSCCLAVDLLGRGKARGVNPERKSCSCILHKGHCHGALLMAVAICCDLPLLSSCLFLIRDQLSHSGVPWTSGGRGKLVLWLSTNHSNSICAWHLVHPLLTTT